MLRVRVLPHFMLVVLAAGPAAGQTPYKLPPKDVVAILDAPPPPQAILSPTRDAILLVEVRPYPSIETLAEPHLRLAGCRINPRTGCSQRTIQYTGLKIQPVSGSPPRTVAIPDGASIHRPSWSHDGKKVAFAHDLQDGVELWVADVATGSAKAIPGARLNDVLTDPIQWQSDNKHILAVLVDEGRGPAPAEPRAPIGPNVQESSGRLSQMATFQDMLASPHYEDLFEHYAKSQIARIDSETGQVERIGPAALYTGVEASPDEKYLLISAVRRPFSYRVPFGDFTRKTEVWDARGKHVAIVADLPISDDIPRQGVAKGPRRVQWQPLHDARLLWTEALDGGDPRTKADHRDKVLSLEAPFTGKPAQVMKVKHRFAGFAWLPEKDQALATELDRDRRWRTTALVDLAKPDESRKVLFDLSINNA
ncbi:MAG TPA: hypothetical protein VGY53_04630, partial [Isosphaeraceae bacterium]|nr:hypothetical protein [Isosphaeraceae bacterium]